MPNPKTFVTGYPTQITTQVYATLANNKGYAVIAYFDREKSATLPTTTSQFAAGCILINTAGSQSVSTTTAIWVNTGSATTPSWTALTIN